MTVGKRAKSDQRLPQDKGDEMARKDRAPDLEGAGGERDSEVVQSAVAALGAPVVAAGVGEKQELELARRRRLEIGGEEGEEDENRNDEIPGVAGRQPGRRAPAQPVRKAEELERNYREDRPGEASARQADPNAAPTPLQRLEEDDDLN